MLVFLLETFKDYPFIKHSKIINKYKKYKPKRRKLSGKKYFIFETKNSGPENSSHGYYMIAPLTLY